MKKTIFTLLIAICAVAFVNAQDLTSKKGVPILPQEGDWSIGIDAVPFLNYAGNLFNSGNTAPIFDFRYPNQMPYTIYGKYFKDAQTAYRAYFRLGMCSETFKHLTPEDGSTADPVATVEDKWTNSETSVTLGFGIEKRRGHGRVQGIYGAQVFIAYMAEKDKYTYGNSFVADPDPGTWWDFYEGGYFGKETPRPTEYKYGSTFGIGAEAFVGVEYFFAPCMSLGGEFGWGIQFQSTGKGESTYEYWENNAVKERTFETGGASLFCIDTDNWYGAITLNFFF